MRPCFIILDSDFPGSISSRKLVIESAKLNVITAYSQQEALETLERYPRVDGIVVNAQMEGHLSCGQIIKKLRDIRPNIPIVTVSANGDRCDGEQFHVSSYDPRQLLSALEEICPKAAPAIEHDDEIAREKRNKPE